MWYEQMWSGLVTLGCLGAALYISGPFNKLDTGRWFRRNFANHPRIEQTKRDHRLTGNMYRISDLSSIKDA